MGLKKYIKNKIIGTVREAVREEISSIDRTSAINESSIEKNDVEQRIINKLDKQIERWTWDRYKRLGNQDIPSLKKQIDAETWDIQKNNEKSVERWTWDRCQRTNKYIERWTWDRCQRTNKDIERWTWERYQRASKDLEKQTELINDIKQHMLDILFERKKVRYNGGRIKVVMLFQIPSCWSSVESVWNEMTQDERFNAQMLLYDREQREPAQMAGAREFLEENGIPFVEAEHYDLIKEKPHVFIYQTPWDDRHRPDFLKADHIKSLGIRVAYLPYGIEYSASVRLSWIFSVMQFKARPWMSFSLSPEVLLDHKLGSGYGADFLRVTGLPKFDALYNKEQFILDAELSKKINERKVIFWQMHFPALDGNEDYPEPNITEYCQFMSKISEYTDLFFLIRPHPKFFEMYIQKGFEKEADTFLEKISDAENVYLYTESDYRPALVNADYIIGDRSALMVESIVLDVPVLYMTNFYYKEQMLPSVRPIFESYYQGSECYDMELFIDMVVKNGIDYKQQDRQKAKNLCVPYFDGKCGKRIVDCIAAGVNEESEEV